MVSRHFFFHYCKYTSNSHIVQTTYSYTKRTNYFTRLAVLSEIPPNVLTVFKNEATLANPDNIFEIPIHNQFWETENFL